MNPRQTITMSGRKRKKSTLDLNVASFLNSLESWFVIAFTRERNKEKVFPTIDNANVFFEK